MKIEEICYFCSNSKLSRISLGKRLLWETFFVFMILYLKFFITFHVMRTARIAEIVYLLQTRFDILTDSRFLKKKKDLYT